MPPCISSRCSGTTRPRGQLPMPCGHQATPTSSFSRCPPDEDNLVRQFPEHSHISLIHTGSQRAGHHCTRPTGEGLNAQRGDLPVQMTRDAPTLEPGTLVTRAHILLLLGHTEDPAGHIQRSGLLHATGSMANQRASNCPTLESLNTPRPRRPAPRPAAPAGSGGLGTGSQVRMQRAE